MIVTRRHVRSQQAWHSVSYLLADSFTGRPPFTHKVRHRHLARGVGDGMLTVSYMVWLSLSRELSREL
jgi:hypothetical protein